MRRASSLPLLFLLLLLLLLLAPACAGEAPTCPPAATASAVAPLASSAPAATASAVATSEPWAGSCEARGLPRLNPCPSGGAPGPDDLSMPETLVFCCDGGSAADDHRQGCLTALEAARGCKDKEGERRVRWRLAEMQKATGKHPCAGLEPSFSAFKGHEKLCRELGYRWKGP